MDSRFKLKEVRQFVKTLRADYKTSDEVTRAPDATGPQEQGFLTNTNRFVDREEAGKIEFATKQTTTLKETLYSEDLY